LVVIAATLLKAIVDIGWRKRKTIKIPVKIIENIKFVKNIIVI